MDEQDFKDLIESMQRMDDGERTAKVNAVAGSLTADQVQLLQVTSFVVGAGAEFYDALIPLQETAVANDKTIADSKIIADGAAAGLSAQQVQQRQAAEGNDISGAMPEISDSDMALINTFGGQQRPTDTQVKQLLEWASISDGVTYGSWDEYYESGRYVDPIVQQAAQNLGLQPDNPTQFVFFKGQKEAPTIIGLPEMERAMTDFPIKEPGDMGSYVQFARSYGMRDAVGGAAWQPLLALMQATGYFAANDSRKSGAAKYTAWVVELNDIKKKIEAAGPTARGRGANSALLERQAELRRLTSAHVRGNDAVILQPRDLANAYNEGMSAYGSDPFLASIHAIDPGLAMRTSSAYDSENDELNLSDGDARMLAQIVRDMTPGSTKSDFTSTMEGIGLGDSTSMLADLLADSRLRNALSGGGGGGGKAERVLPDRDAVKQSAKDMYRQLFLTEPDDAQLESFTNQVFGVISSAADNQSVDASAQLRKISEGLPEYQKFYGNKPGGMTEQEYQGQFALGQQSILGNELAGNQAVRLGMQDGKYQTAVGAAAGTAEAADNSTFQGRLAQAAQVISGKT